MPSPEDMLVFFDRGGWVLWAILLVSSLMWIVIVERAWFLRFGAADLAAELSAYWRGSHSRGGYARETLRAALVERFAQAVEQRIGLLNSLATVLPMLGLLGTVTGMIRTFEVMTMFGSGNARGMAAGISEALYTTMAGLMTGLAGAYLASHIDGWAQNRLRHFSHRLAESQP